MLRLGSLHQRIKPLGLKKCYGRLRHSFPVLSYDLSHGVPPVFSAVATQKHFKAHQELFAKLNFLVEGTTDENKTLEELIIKHQGQSNTIYNHAAEAYSHNWMWNSVTPGGCAPSPFMLQLIEIQFGSLARFEHLFVAYGNAIHGSGWVWLIDNDGHLEICPGFNAATPVGRYKVVPLLACDVWEHAYFHDFGIERTVYIKKWLSSVNWDFVEASLKQHHPDRNFTVTKDDTLFPISPPVDPTTKPKRRPVPHPDDYIPWRRRGKTFP